MAMPGSWWRHVVIAAAVLGASACGGGSTPTAAASASPRTTLNSAEQSELATLEARPLKLPALGAGGACPATAMTQVAPYKNQNETIALYGSGPVYGAGGPETNSKTNAYYDVAYLADPSVHGLVLVRIQTLDGLHKGVFVGNYGSGPVVGRDTIGGKQVNLYGQVVLTTLRAETDPSLASGWKTWHLRQGVDISWKCVAIQIDILDTTEVIVVAG
jgi:hypothetical protein